MSKLFDLLVSPYASEVSAGFGCFRLALLDELVAM